MAQLWSTGPALFFVGPGQTSTQPPAATFLGTSEGPPQIDVDPALMPVYNDLGGSMVPLDLCSQGEQAFTFCTLNRYNETVYEALANRPRHPVFNGGLAGAVGKQINGDVGALLQTEGFHLSLWIQFPYATKAAMNTSRLGYRFPVTFMKGPDRVTPGNHPKKIQLVFWHLRRFTPVTNEFLLYDNNMNGLPAIN